jgi:HAD superfamily hydrolase (TIGR01509 family)
MMALPPERWEQANGYWMEENARHTPQPFTGVAGALDRLALRYSLGVVTSGSKGRIQSEMAATGLRRYFQVVVSGDDVTRRKPDPQGLEMALRALGVAAGEAIYVGDAPADWEMARLAGVRFIGVPSKFGALGAGCEVVENVCELEEVLMGRHKDKL